VTLRILVWKSRVWRRKNYVGSVNGLFQQNRPEGDIVLRQSAADFFLRFVSLIAGMNCRLRRLAKELRCR
jgi:hypothetical protein